jgi:dolichyl-diphosphooligosaccharide--protein glycosyltransferase
MFSAFKKGGENWLARNWQTVLVMALILLLAMFLRSYFAYSVSVEDGEYLVSGGSDSYYHMRVIEHVTDSGQHLVFDDMLNYPFGMRNPRPPLYDWSVAVTGEVVSGLTGSASEDGWGAVLVLSTAFWGTMTVIPVYLIGRSAFGNKAGILAAFLFAIMPAHIERSVLSNADHDAMVLFFMAFGFYFLLRALQSLKGTKWVASWKETKTIVPGLKGFFDQNRIPLIYATLGGVCVAAVAMIWTGYTELIVIILIYLLVQLIIDRLRNSDSMGSVIVVGTMLLTAFVIMAPLYWQMNYWTQWYDIPFYLFLVGMIAGAIFVVTRDLPWALVLPSIIVLAVVGLLALSVFAPGLFEAVITGQGYLVKSKLYSTISEAQPPMFSNLALSFGALTFWFAVFGVIYAATRIPKNTSPYFIFLVVWTAASIYLASSAARFLFNAAPAFAVISGWVLAEVMVWIKLHDVFKNMRAMKGSFFKNFYRAIKFRHVAVVLIIVFLVITPNVWTAVDASISNQQKKQYDQEIYNGLPGFMKPSESQYQSSIDNGTTWFLGAFGYSVTQPTTYWPAAWSWYSTQDAGLNETEKPSFLSWWDYGFEAIQEGDHPTVADNFQNGYEMAGSFLMAQNESQGIALFIVRLLEKHGWEDAEVKNAIIAAGVNYTAFANYMANPKNDIPIVMNNPSKYGPYQMDPSSVASAANARLVTSMFELCNTTSDKLVDLYHKIRDITETEIGYYAVDNRLFPYSATYNNIFFAPAKLSDHRVDPKTGIPYDFYQIFAVDQYGNKYTLNNVTSDMTIVSYTIEYYQMFYNTLLYKCMMGFGPSDLGLTTQGIPGISGSLSSYSPLQGWNMTHFKMVYRTAYYNPYTDYANHSSDWRAVSYEQALYYDALIKAKLINGTVDLTSAASYAQAGGVVFLQYYDGAIIEGDVKTESGSPMANIWVSVQDENNITHMTVMTNATGHYRILAPFGKNATGEGVKLIYSYGKLDRLTQTATIIKTVNYNITYAMAMRESAVGSSLAPSLESDSSWIINGSITLPGADLRGLVFWDINGDGTFTDGDIIVEDATVVIENTTIGFNNKTKTSLTGYAFLGQAPKVVSVYAIVNGHTISASTIDLVPNTNNTRNIAIKPASISGTLKLPSSLVAPGVGLMLKDMTNGTLMYLTSDSTGKFSFTMLLPGDYTLSATDPSLTLGTQLFSLTQNEKIDKIIYVGNAVQVSGLVTYNFSSVPYARVLFCNEFRQIWAEANATGRYVVTLPAGAYTVYAVAYKDGEQLAYLDTLVTSIPWTLHIPLSVAKSLVGKATYNNASAANAVVMLKDDDSGAVLNAVTNSTGGFRFVVPTDAGPEFHIYIGGTAKGAYWDALTFNGNTVANFALAPSAWVNGTVWYDSNHNGQMTTAKGMQNALVSVTSNGTTALFVTSSVGKYSIILPKGGNYSFVASIANFDAQYFQADNLQSDMQQNYSMVPSLCEVSGKVSGMLPVEASFSFDAVAGSGGVSQGVTTVGGSFSTSLRPGVYVVNLDQNVSEGSDLAKYQFLQPITMTIAIGELPILMMLDAVERVLVNGNVTAGNATLRYMAPLLDDFTFSANGNYSIYLQRGEYSLWGVLNGTPNLAVLEKVNVSGPMAYDVSFVNESFYLNIELTFQGSSAGVPLSYAIESSLGPLYTGIASANGTAALQLPAGQYSILVDDRVVASVNGSPRYLRFTVLKDFEVAQNTTLPLAMTRAYDNSTISGLPVGTSVRFLAMNATAMSVPFQPSSFVLSLAPGIYSVYVKQDLGTDVYLGQATVWVGMPYEFTIALLPGTQVVGTASIGGVGTQATVTFSTGGATADLTTAADGTYTQYLPAETYAAVATATIIERGVNITYRDSTTVAVSGGTVGLSFEMQKLVDHGVKLTWNSQERRVVNPGETATYNIKVTNTGNVDDTYKITSYKVGWNITIQSNVTVPFGGSVTLTMSLTPELGSKAGNISVDVSAVSTNDTTSASKVTVSVGVRANYGVNLTYTKAEPVTSTAYIYDMKLTNTGNLLDTFEINVTNREYLALNGWNVTLKYSGLNYTDTLSVRLSAGESGTIMMRLTPTRPIPNPSISVVLVATSKGDSSKSDLLPFTPEFPNLQVVGNTFSVTGPKVSSSDFQVPGETYFLFGLSIVLVALVVILSLRKGVLGRGKR